MPADSETKRIWLKLAIGVTVVAVLAAVAISLGPRFGNGILAMEHWVARQGPWAPLVFAALFMILTPLFVPAAVLAAAAGALFGVVTGVASVALGSLGAQFIAFTISRRLLHDRVKRELEGRPKLAAIERGADSGGLRLQCLIRLTPISAVVVSYVLGTTRVRLAPFLVACVGLIPGLVVEVYSGFAAKHVLKVASGVDHPSPMHTVLIVSGLALAVLVLLYVTRRVHGTLVSG